MPKFRHVTTLDKIPALADSTKKLIAKAAKKPEIIKQVKERVEAYLKTCLANGSPLESLDQVWIDAIRLAESGDLNAGWTRETIHEGLQKVIYRQYDAPRDTSFS